MRIAFAAAGVSLLALVAAAPALADQIAASSKITSVAVYPDAASVTRVAELELPKGSSTILFKGLPIGIDPVSLRVAGEGPAGLVIGTVEQRIAPAERPPVDDSLEARVKALKTERAQLQVSLDALERRRAMIVRFSEAGPEKLSPESKPLDVDKWNAAWDAVGTAMAKVGEDLRTGRAKANELDLEILNLEASRTRPDNSRGPARDILVAVDADGAAKASLTLTYRVTGASWRPVYDARLDTGGESKKPGLELVRRAAVTQRTGEDWKDVALSVSTVRIDRGTAAPDIQPLIVGFAPQGESYAAPASASRLAHKSRAAPAMGGMARDEAVPAPAPAPTKPAVEASARLDAGAYQASFGVPGQISVPNDGAEKSFRLDSTSIKPTVILKTAPALDPTAYLAASFVNAGEAPLLPGQVALVRDGMFVGSGQIGLVASGDKLDLGFGADDRVKVTRTPVKRLENDPIWIGSNKVMINEFKTTVKNLHAFAVKVTIVDQVPVSEVTTIVVEKLPVTTPPTEKVVGDKRGVLSWTYELAPNASKEVHIAWRLRWPADSDVSLTSAPVQGQ